MPGILITQKDMSAGAVSHQKRDFDTRDSKSQEARVFFSWGSRDSGLPMPHSLGKVPTSYTVVDSGSSQSISCTTGGTTTLTSAAKFGASEGDILKVGATGGTKVVGKGIPDGTYVVGYTDASTITLSQAATDSTGNIRTFISVPKVYSADPVLWATRNRITLYSDTANSWADVIIR